MLRIFRGRVFIGFLLSVMAISVAADDVSHRQAARDFYVVAKVDDVVAVSKAVTDMVTQIQPSLRAHHDIIADYAEEIMRSKKFVDARVAVYQSLFSEEELKTLTWLFRHDTFQVYRERRVDLVKQNAQVTFDLFKDALPGLQRRIGERIERQRSSLPDQ